MDALHFSISHSSGKTGQVWKSDGTRHPTVEGWDLWTGPRNRPLGPPKALSVIAMSRSEAFELEMLMENTSLWLIRVATPAPPSRSTETMAGALVAHEAITRLLVVQFGDAGWCSHAALLSSA